LNPGAECIDPTITHWSLPHVIEVDNELNTHVFQIVNQGTYSVTYQTVPVPVLATYVFVQGFVHNSDPADSLHLGTIYGHWTGSFSYIDVFTIMDANLSVVTAEPWRQWLNLSSIPQGIRNSLAFGVFDCNRMYAVPLRWVYLTVRVCTQYICGGCI